MQMGRAIFLMLALTRALALPDNYTAHLWKQALQHHGWSPRHDHESAGPQCQHMPAGATDIKLDNTGFHGHITYTVSLTSVMDLAACNLTVLQLLPAGIYADPYELENVVTTSHEVRGNALHLSSFKVFGVVDVEKIESDCSQTLLSVSAWHAASQTQGESCTAQSHVRLTVPLHARYPPPTEARTSGFATQLFGGLHQYNITQPVFQIERAEQSGPRRTCYSSPIQEASTNAQQTLHWTVPTGGMWHMQVVEIVTTLTAVYSVCYLLKSISQDA